MYLGSINSNVQKCVNMLLTLINSFKPSDLDKSIESFNKDLKSCKKVKCRKPQKCTNTQSIR